MSGFEKLTSPLDRPEPVEDRSSTGLDASALWQDVSSLPKSPNTASPHLPELEWTIAVDLTANLDLNGVKLGAEKKTESLMQLVDASRGKPDAAFVVQAVHGSFADRPADESVVEDGQLDRFIIQNGQISNMQTVQNEGISANQTELLRYATDLAPSDHIGLVIQSHGGGSDGLLGGTGREPLDALSSAIKQGLEGSNHEALDILDFDACSMATPGVLQAMAPVADNVIASELRERGSENLNGQNLTAMFSALLNYSRATPEELSRMFVESANSGVTPEHLKGDPFLHSSADVLASFDTSQYRAFSNAMNELGARLQDVSQGTNVRGEIEKLFDSATPLVGGENYPERRDLGQFLSALQVASKEGRIPDDDGEIFAAAQNAIDAQSQMTGSLIRTNDPIYANLAGMYTFLPNQAVRDGLADGPNGLQWMNKAAARQIKNKDEFVGNLEAASADILRRVSEPAQIEFQPVVDAIDRVKNSRSDGEFEQSIEQLQATVESLFDSNLEKELIAQVVRRDDVPNADEWNAFMQSFVPAS